MATTLDDLPGDLSSDECEAKDVTLMGPKTRAPPCKKRKASHPPRAAQQPTKKRAPSSTTESPKTDNLISLELARSIDAASVRALRDLLKKVCRENVEARKLAEEQLLSEEDKEKLRQLDEDECFSDQTTESSRESRERWRRNRLEISGDWCGHSKFLDEAGELFRQFAHYDQSVLPKAKEDAKRIEATLHPHSNRSATFPTCLNCGKKFNPRTNFHGECKWHSEKYKIPDEDASVWADHDEDCHGPYESFENDPLYASGFLWGCCEAEITDEGCMSTRHRAASPVEDGA